MSPPVRAGFDAPLSIGARHGASPSADGPYGASLLMERRKGGYILSHAQARAFQNMIRFAHRAFALPLLASVVLSPFASRAQATGEPACEAVEQTESLRNEGHYRKARARLLECVNAQCGGDVRRRCAATLQKLDAVTPSIVVRAEDPAHDDVLDVSVSLGDEVLVSSLDGMAIPVDPGEHRFVFKRPGHDPVTQTLTIAQGEKFRAIDVVIGSAPALALPPIAEVGEAASSGSSDRLVATGTLIGVGVVALATGTVLGLRARAGEHALEDNCAPGCSDGRVDSVKTRYLLANVSLGVGVLAAGAATWLLLSAPSVDPVADHPSGLAIGADSKGAFAAYSGSF
jgi:hypothetical protein